ncbi:P1 family peptidase [Ovoidimarina sediminis]|uniref:P1 family peptidase n=1 Tax=Ovoidimarina sediminis TaxID=3079856 RepID=UPI002914716E|nr:P1 family peptidase [Rhodophyticola sp. MJ-SS7]MDU8943521.1 P1 family peptidase [Rhodophyticola sp. MJ-SS7]
MRRNLITDVEGVLVGNAADGRVKSGVTVLTSDRPFTASVHVMGGAPGTRETDLLDPANTVQEVDALVLSGGSAFGLDAASGVSEALRAAGRGFPVSDHVRVPIVPAAIILDVGRNGGAVDWDDPPWRALGRAAFGAASEEFGIGTAGAGTGATCVNLKGGLGSASARLETGAMVGALAVANPIGQVTVGEGPEFWAAAFEDGAEFGGRGMAAAPGAPPRTKVEPRSATAIAIVATDLRLSKAQCKRMAVMAHDGIARAVVPSHTPFDGDAVFAAATARRGPASDLDMIRVGHAAATCLARAMARAVYAATPAEGDLLPTWQARFGG